MLCLLKNWIINGKNWFVVVEINFFSGSSIIECICNLKLKGFFILLVICCNFNVSWNIRNIVLFVYFYLECEVKFILIWFDILKK